MLGIVMTKLFGNTWLITLAHVGICVMTLFLIYTFGVPLVGEVATLVALMSISLRVVRSVLRCPVRRVILHPVCFLDFLQRVVSSPFLPPSGSLLHPQHLQPRFPVFSALSPRHHLVKSASASTRASPAVTAANGCTSVWCAQVTTPSPSALVSPRGTLASDMETESSTSQLDDLSDCAFPPPSGIYTPVRVSALDSLLSGYDVEIHSFLISGFSVGFRIGFCGSLPLNSERNNFSAFQCVEPVSTAILKELRRGHTAGPFSHPPRSDFMCSPLGAVPKKDGTQRIILDLSAPSGFSVNDGIPDCSVHYTSFDEAVELIKLMGKGCFLAKVDIRHAFRLCPVHPDDWHLLGFQWRGRLYHDVCLPFGLRSSPLIFNCFADALLWILSNKFGVVGACHYLDDFLLSGSSEDDCRTKRDLFLFSLSILGVPIAEDKLEGPSQVLTFLGIEIDTQAGLLRVPPTKLVEIKGLVILWTSRRKCTKRELLSLIGSLSFVCRVIRPGRIFLRRMIDLAHSVKSLHHHIDISASVRKDLAMWFVFLDSWNGSAFLQERAVSSSDLDLFTDASGLGLGAFFQGAWVSEPWPFSTVGINIALLELFAVFTAISCWSSALTNKHIIILTDNEAIVAIWASGSSRDKQIMALVRALFFLCTNLNLSIVFKHLPGVLNPYADHLSRLQVERFLSICPSADHSPTSVPQSVWTSWDNLWKDT